MQYVTLMIGEDFWLTVHIQPDNTSIVPHESYLTSCSDWRKQKSFSFYANVSGGVGCWQAGIMGNVSGNVFPSVSCCNV